MSERATPSDMGYDFGPPGQSYSYRGDRVDLVHSPDDGGHYAQRWDDDTVSPLYETRRELIKAMTDGRDVEFVQRRLE